MQNVNFLLMLYFLRKYPVSCLILLAVVYLSFFRTPDTELGKIPHMDKVVHFCMYFGLSGMLWVEFFRARRTTGAPWWHAWVGAFVCPVAFSGCVELLQQFLTDYRSGDWLDFAANAAGVLVASLAAYFWARPRLPKWFPSLFAGKAVGKA